MISTVHHIDCLIGMQNIPDKSIDMILCDLPYGTTACKWDVIIPFEPLWKQYERIIKDNGAIVLTASQPFTSMLVMSNPKLFKYEWTWIKSHSSGFQYAKYRPMQKHESILVFGKGKVNYNPQMQKGLMKATRSGKPETNRMDRDAVFRGVKSILSIIHNDLYFPTTNLLFSSGARSKSFHPTQKPVALFEYLIKTYTNEGETVLDNCAGSGTTAIACMNTNRNYILMEKEEKYYNIILERIKKHVPQLKLIA